MTAIDLISRVLFRDNNLIILDKPAGLAVHAGPKTSENLESMLGDLSFGLRQPPRLAHRLDRDTSGCLVLARHDKALVRLGRLFTAHQVLKTYWAVVKGRPDAAFGRIELSLKKVSNQTGWRMIADAGGKAAVTEWSLCGADSQAAWLEMRPLNGRTHQIRVHCASGLGCPILGDPIYGTSSGEPMHLFARSITIPYRADQPPIVVEASPPPHMLARLSGLKKA